MPEVTIGPARPEDVAAIPRIEARAATLLAPEDLPPALAAETTSLEDAAAAQREGRLLVARAEGGDIVGFALMVLVDDAAHLEELDVDPDHGRRGIGRALVMAAIRWAAARGDVAITLSTFERVPWNAPFYARLGFEPTSAEDWTPGLRAVRSHERALGLDVSKRVIMRRAVGEGDV